MTPIAPNYAQNGFRTCRVSTLFCALKCLIFEVTAKICVGYCILLH
jgi:hypothetical protein